jgi:hypothetical protein
MHSEGPFGRASMSWWYLRDVKVTPLGCGGRDEELPMQAVSSHPHPVG